MLKDCYNGQMMKYNKYITVILVAITLCNCSVDKGTTSDSVLNHAKNIEEVAIGNPEATSLLGKELYAPRLEPEERAKRQAARDKALAAYIADPQNEENIIWYGRRTAYLGQYNDSIKIYSNGLKIFPASYKLLRHRGHRFISIRQYERAIKDYERAFELIDGVADQVEPDGMPNAKNIPLSTTHSNIYYHLGLARYLTGDYLGTAEAYRKNLEFAKNDDMLCANTYWLYLSLRRQGDTDAAEATLIPIDSDLDVIENFAYHKLLLAYKSGGEGDVDALLGTDGIDSIEDATTAYGVGAWYLLEGDTKRAEEIFMQIVEGPDWPAFGHIAAEVELARAGK